MRYLKSAVGVAAVVAMSFIIPAQAGSVLRGDVDNGRKIFTQGKGDAVPACASCHGAGGLGQDDMGTPRLAHQVFTYELKQLTDFANDKRIDNTLNAMNDIAKALTPQERMDVISYVEELKTPFLGSDLKALEADGTEVGDRSRGAMIVEYGAEGIVSCKSCHGFHGRSAGRMFPMLGGQRYVYLLNQLHAWKDGTVENGRANDPMGMMRNVAKTMSEKDMQDVAAFLTGALPYTSGNPMEPPRGARGFVLKNTGGGH